MVQDLFCWQSIHPGILGSSTYSASISSHGEQYMTFLPCSGPGNLIPVRKGLLVLPLLRE